MNGCQDSTSTLYRLLVDQIAPSNAVDLVEELAACWAAVLLDEHLLDCARVRRAQVFKTLDRINIDALACVLLGISPVDVVEVVPGSVEFERWSSASGAAMRHA